MSLLRKIKNQLKLSVLINLLFIINLVACDGCSHDSTSQNYGDLTMSIYKNNLTGEED